MNPIHQVPIVPVSGNYPPNAPLPLWTPQTGNEGYDQGIYTSMGFYPTQPGMIQQPGSYSGREMPPRYPAHNNIMVNMPASRQKSKKRRPQMAPDNAKVMRAQGNTTMPMMPINYIPNSSGFMMPGSPAIPQAITTLHNSTYLAPQALSSMPRDHSRGVSLRNTLPSTRLPQQQLSQLLSHPPQVGVSTTIAPAMCAPAQLAPLTINTSGAGLNKASPSKADIYPPTPVHDILDNLTEAEWIQIMTPTGGSGPVPIPNCSATAKQAQTAQQVPPASQIQGGVLPPCNVSTSSSFCQQQIPQIQDQQTQAVASTSTRADSDNSTGSSTIAQRGVKSLSPCNNVSAIHDPQQPFPKTQNTPQASQSYKEGPSPSITTVAPHPGPISSKTSTSSDKSRVSVGITQDLVTSINSTSTYKSDQQPVCGPSHSVNQDDDDECSPPNSPMPVRAPSPRSMLPPIQDHMDFIEKLIHDDSDLSGEELKLVHHYIARKRKSTAVLENGDDDENAAKKAKKDSGRDDHESLMPLLLLNYMHMKNIREEQRTIRKELMNISEQLRTFHGLQQVKVEDSAAQGSCQRNAMKEESSGIRRDDCCWNGEKLLEIQSQDPCKYALKLLQKLFPDPEERAEHCYRRGSRTSTKQALDEKRVKILENCIKFRFGLNTFLAYEEKIGQKLNQKCLDAKKKV